jgi:hypothetical protein
MLPLNSGPPGFRRTLARRGGFAVLLMLAGTAAAQAPQRTADAADAAERAGDPQDRVICKRFIETGSLVKGYRSCKTKREWERERDNIRSPRTTSGSCNSGESGSCGGA